MSKYRAQYRRRKAVSQAKARAARALKIAGAAALALALALSAVITAGEHLGWPTPTWAQIYGKLHIGRVVQVPAASEGAATRIHFIDAGQADATLIEQSGAFALVDAGLRDDQERLADYLRAAGVEELDYLILTHPHGDHIGGMSYILRHFPVGQLLMPALEEVEPENAYALETLLKWAGREGVPLHTLEEGDTFPLGQGELEVLCGGLADGSVNDLCPVMRFEAPHIRFLFTGDAERPVEQKALDSGADLRADLFKGAHHGSSTSNSLPFLRAVRPDYVAVSCGARNDYGHPHREAVQAFADVGAHVYRTDQLGDIVFYVDAEGVIQLAASRQEGALAA